MVKLSELTTFLVSTLQLEAISDTLHSTWYSQNKYVRTGVIVIATPVIAIYSLKWMVFNTRFVRGVARHALMKMFSMVGNPFPPDTEWDKRVQPHEELEELDENLWVVKGTLPALSPPIPRVMVIYRLPPSNGSSSKAQDLLVYSPMCLRQSVMDQIKKLGNIKYIFVSCSWHTLDIMSYKSAFPSAQVVAPRQTAEAIHRGKKGKVDVIAETLFPTWPSIGSESNVYGNSVRLVTPKGHSATFDEMELLVWLHGSIPTSSKRHRHALICNDLFHSPSKPDKTKQPCKLDIKKDVLEMTGIVRILAVGSMCEFGKWLETGVVDLIEKENVEIFTASHADPVVGGMEKVKSIVGKAVRDFVS